MFLSKGSSAPTTAIPSLLNVMMELRKCCNHPFLIKGTLTFFVCVCVCVRVCVCVCVYLHVLILSGFCRS